MENTVTISALAAGLLSSLEKCAPNTRLLVGISGGPASGKTTLAGHLAAELNAARPDDEICVVVPLDGWHYTRFYLSGLPNAAEAFQRRGAEWTFDAESYSTFVSRLRLDDQDRGAGTSESPTLAAPSFSHALKDPTPSSIEIRSSHRVVILEGLYVFLDTPRWRAAGQALNERWYLSVDEELAAQRLITRHVQAGIADTEAAALDRALQNDIPNGRFVEKNMMEPTRVISSHAIRIS